MSYISDAIAYAESLENKYRAAAVERGTPGWTNAEYLEICAARQVVWDSERGTRKQENMAVLSAVGLLHPDMTQFEIDMFHLPETVWADPTLLAAVVAENGALDHGEIYLAEAYADAFKALPKDQQAAVREAILQHDGWRKWAATKA